MALSFSKRGRLPLKRSQNGVTMVELLTTVAVSAALLGVAVPNLSEFVQDNRIITTTNDFVSAINAGRAEAVKRGATVILCRTGNPGADPSSLACRAPTPEGEANQRDDWAAGWIMYVKPGYSGVGGTGGDYNHATDGDPIAVGNAAPGGVKIKSNSEGNQWLAFYADGTLNEGGGTALYAVCDDRGVEPGRLVTVPSVGRPLISAAPADCDP